MKSIRFAHRPPISRAILLDKYLVFDNIDHSMAYRTCAKLRFHLANQTVDYTRHRNIFVHWFFLFFFLFAVLPAYAAAGWEKHPRRQWKQLPNNTETIHFQTDQYFTEIVWPAWCEEPNCQQRHGHGRVRSVGLCECVCVCGNETMGVWFMLHPSRQPDTAPRTSCLHCTWMYGPKCSESLAPKRFASDADVHNARLMEYWIKWSENGCRAANAIPHRGKKVVNVRQTDRFGQIWHDEWWFSF